MRARKLLVSFSFLMAAFIPAVSAHALPISDKVDGLDIPPPIHITCTFRTNAEVSQDIQTTEGCDLGVDKLVSVNGGTFQEADTSSAAAQATVGDTVTWKIIITNNSDGMTPQGRVYIKDVLPSGVTYVSNTATDGVYHPNDGSFDANLWNLPTQKDDGDGGFVTTLPATLLITTKASSTGLFENVAALAYYDPGTCDGGRCAYTDDDLANNQNSAWLDPSAAPVVLGASSTTGAPNTGYGQPSNDKTFGIILLAAALALMSSALVSVRLNGKK